jgi:ABC-type nitrate/sulfonate/bicarbonate transport system ATPase subunit
MIQLEKVTFTYPEGQVIFQDFVWEIEQQQSWAVLGQSGCGKTTLLYLLAGLIFPQAGRIKIAGQDLVRPRPETGLILQDYGLLPWATVRQNASLGLQVRDFYGPDGKHAPLSPNATRDVPFWLRRLGIEDVADQYPGQLSGGQRQRTAIARTLVLQPDLLLMDEPFSSLDAVTRQDLQSLTLQLWLEQRFTYIVVTHDISEAIYLGKTILVLGKPPHTHGFVVENSVFGQVEDEQNRLAHKAIFSELRTRLGEQ